MRRRSILRHYFLGLAVCFVLLVGIQAGAAAILYNYPNGAVSGGSVGIEGTVSSAPPTESPTISTPSAGSTFTTSPISVAGLCQTGLIVKVFSNNIFVGSDLCTSGSFSMQVALFSGRNDIVAQLFDALDQAGPDSNVVSVTFNDAEFLQYGTRVSLSSSYAERGADPGTVLSWPINLSGGVAPYAISVDWGDSSSPELISQSASGVVTISHTYSTAGVYKVVVTATDSNGTTGFLQLVGVGNGQASVAAANNSNTAEVVQKTNVVWWPMILFVPMIIGAFLLGGRYELFAIRHELDKSRNENQ